MESRRVTRSDRPEHERQINHGQAGRARFLDRPGENISAIATQSESRMIGILPPRFPPPLPY